MTDHSESRSLPGPSNAVQIPPRDSVSFGILGQALPAEEAGRGPTTSSPSRIHTPEQPYGAPPNHQPSAQPGPVTSTGPNTLSPQQNGEPIMRRHSDTQQIPPSQNQIRGPTFRHLGQNGQPVISPPLPSQRQFPPFPHSVPVFGPLHDRTGQVVGLVHQGSFSVSERSSAGPGIGQMPPRRAQAGMYPHPVYPQTQPRAPSQIVPQMLPQVPPRMQGPMPMNWGAQPGPPPPYPEPTLASREPRPGQAGPSMIQRRVSETSAMSRPQMRVDQDDEAGDDGSGSDVWPFSARGRAGSGPTRMNPPRKARPKDLSESD